MFRLRVFLPLLGGLLAGCSSLTLRNVDFAWPVESVVTVNAGGTFEDPQRGLTVNVTPLSVAEFEDSTALRGSKLRVVRDGAGYYFITGARFKRVYVFTPGERALSLAKAIEVSAQGLKDPALNLRPAFVEVLDATLTPPLRLKYDGIVEGDKQ